MTFLTKTTLWASRWPGPPLRISVSVRSAFGMTGAKLSNTSDYALLFCLSGARLDLSAEDDAVALVLAECLMSLKVIHFQSIFLIDFYLKKD